MLYLNRYSKASAEDIALVARDLGRAPRGMLSVAARASAGDPLNVTEGTPLVVMTAPRVESRRDKKALEPFPTLFYLTNSTYASYISKLEAEGYMKELQALLQEDQDLQEKYLRAHQEYIRLRDQLADELGIERLTSTHADFSAGGMPERVKCLHALIGHSLATMRADGTSDNPIGDIAILAL